VGKAEINGFIHKYICDYLIIRLRIPHIVGNKKKGKGFINPFQVSGEFTRGYKELCVNTQFRAYPFYKATEWMPYKKYYQIRLIFNYWHTAKSIFCSDRLKKISATVKIPVENLPR